jgi:hypothetical protein
LAPSDSSAPPAAKSYSCVGHGEFIMLLRFDFESVRLRLVVSSELQVVLWRTLQSASVPVYVGTRFVVFRETGTDRSSGVDDALSKSGPS